MYLRTCEAWDKRSDGVQGFKILIGQQFRNTSQSETVCKFSDRSCTDNAGVPIPYVYTYGTERTPRTLISASVPK